MNKIFFKVISVATAIALCVSSGSLETFVNEVEANAVSYRSSYTIYGDLNGDNVTDVFDVIEMRKKLIIGEYSKTLDLNADNKVDSEDLTLLSDYILGKKVFFDAYFYDDADQDGICDMLEVALLKTDPDSADTDGDTLSDYDEIVYTKTSPTDKYTRGLSVSDANDDSDEDKLTNKEEISYGTNPQLADSDYDDISDYDEVKKHMTDPNDEDSDGDNILDGDELKLGLKPDKDKSDGITLDNQRTFEQKILTSNEFLSYINTEDSPYELSIDITSAGIAEKSLSVHTGEFANASEDERFKGKSVSLSYNDKLKADSAKIYFKPKEINKIEDYMIFEYFPETNYLLPVETKYTEDSVYTEATKLGTYCLVDISEESSVYNKSVGFSSDEIIYDYELGETEVAFFVDISGSLNETALEETKKSIHDFSQALFEHSENSYVTIIGYYSNPITGDLRKPQYSDSKSNKLLNTIDSVDEALSDISPITGINNDLNVPLKLINDMSKDGLFSSDCKNKYAFILVDSTYTMTNSQGYKLTIPKITENYLNNISYNEIHLNYILSSENYSKTLAVNNLKKVCDPLGFGVYSKSSVGYFANDSFAKIYSDAIVDFKSIGVAYTSSLNANKIPERVERNAFINSLPKSYDKTKVPEADSDRKIDFKDATVKVGAAKLDKNGNLVFPSLYDACDVSDAARLGYDQYMMNKAISDKLISGSIQIVPFNDKIMYEDNDGDGIPNKDDPYPDEAFDERFEIINDFNYEPSIDFVDRHYKNSRECYDSKKNVLGPNTKGLAIATLFLEDSSGFANKASFFLNQSEYDFGLYPEREKDSSALNHAFEAMRHYLVGSGKEVNYSELDTCELISSSMQNLMHLLDNINRTMRCAEGALKNGNKVIICPKSDQKLKAVCLIKNKAENDTKDPADIVNCEIIPGKETGLKFHSTYYCNHVHRDWNLTVGEAIGTIVAKVERNGDKFTMYYKYYFKDIYEWAYHYELDPSATSTSLHYLHETGTAKEYLMQGYFEGYLTWNLNDRVVDSDVVQQIFTTLADKEGGLENNIWKKSNEIDRIKYILDLEW